MASSKAKHRWDRMRVALVRVVLAVKYLKMDPSSG